MRSIFAKISLWATVTTIVSLVGFAATTRLIWGNLPGPADLVPKIMTLAREDARQAYERDGPRGLARTLRRLDEIFGAEHFLVDESGADLLGGGDRSRWLSMASSPPYPPRRDGGRFILASEPARGPRLLIAIPATFNPAGLLPYYLWIFLVIAALGYALAIHLGRPLLSLRRAVERFGKGDLAARTGSTRRDEIGELARAFDLMAQRTQTLMTAQRRLLQDVSHELRSPLSRLGLAVRLARTSDDRQASLDRIKREGDRLTALVDGLLRVAEVEEDSRARDREEVRLDELLKALVDEGAMEADARGCRLDLTMAGPVAVSGDRELLRRAVENVLRNAIRHAPVGSAVECGLRRDGGLSTITVRDLGIGVPEGSLAAIFEPFHRVDADRGRSGGGVGLGLAITRRSVALHGGRITAENARPGLRVTIELPENGHTIVS